MDGELELETSGDTLARYFATSEGANALFGLALEAGIETGPQPLTPHNDVFSDLIDFCRLSGLDRLEDVDRVLRDAPLCRRAFQTYRRVVKTPGVVRVNGAFVPLLVVWQHGAAHLSVFKLQLRQWDDDFAERIVAAMKEG